MADEMQCAPLCQFSDRLFFTTFPSPAPHPKVVNIVASRPNPPLPRIHHKPSRHYGRPSISDDTEHTLYHYFTADDLSYLSFYEDWGPMNLGQVWRACVFIHDYLHDAKLADYRLVLYTSDDPKQKANTALIMALYMLVVVRRPPWECFDPIAELEFMPFRDAGRGRSDFGLSIHDCLWGMWKAQRNDLLRMNDFNITDYEYYEKVENGDWNWITPGFIAFASPNDPVWIRQQKNGGAENRTPGGKFDLSSFERKLPQPYQNCLDYFEEKGVKLVVRLNNPLYDRTTFEARGMEHVELYFDDGTNPTDEIVREFIARSEATFEAGGSVAVHCKAGLGRTGTLIGAYLIYKYNFTANEAIAFMRIARPGCVVGPQQQYIYQRQFDWAKWAVEDEMKKQFALAAKTLEAARATTPTIEKPLPAAPSTPTRAALETSDSMSDIGTVAPPLQPRKTPTTKRVAHEMEADDDGDASDASDESVLGRKAESVRPSSRGTAPVTKQLRSLSPSGKTTIKTPTAVAGSPAKIVRPKVIKSMSSNSSISTSSGAAPTRSGAPSRNGTVSRNRAASRTGVTPAAGSRVARPVTRSQAAPPSPRKVAAPPAPPARTAATTPKPRILPIRRAKEEPARLPSRPVSQASVAGSARNVRPTTRLPTRRVGATRAASPPLPPLPRHAHTTSEVSINGSAVRSRLPALKRKPVPLAAIALPSSPSKGSVLSSVSEKEIASTMSGGVNVSDGDGAAPAEDAWISGADAKAIVEPSSAGRRPSLRNSVRRRRSSFSAADLM